MAQRAGPTLRCLREDLGLDLPVAADPGRQGGGLGGTVAGDEVQRPRPGRDRENRPAALQIRALIA
jgi:hypothetical protein